MQLVRRHMGGKEEYARSVIKEVRAWAGAQDNGVGLVSPGPAPCNSWPFASRRWAHGGEHRTMVLAGSKHQRPSTVTQRTCTMSEWLAPAHKQNPACANWVILPVQNLHRATYCLLSPRVSMTTLSQLFEDFLTVEEAFRPSAEASTEQEVRDVWLSHGHPEIPAVTPLVYATDAVTLSCCQVQGLMPTVQAAFGSRNVDIRIPQIHTPEASTDGTELLYPQHTPNRLAR